MFIKNEALAEVVAGTLHKTPETLKEDDLRDLIQLDASDRDIDTIEGLQYAVNLEKINLSNNALTNIEPLRPLTSLIDVNLLGNRLRDIDPLNDHYQIKKLNLSRNNLYVMDISAIGSMISLEKLDLKRAKIDSLDYVENCRHLKEIKINTENGPFNYSVLGMLPELVRLDMGGMRRYYIEDLSFLSHIE